MVKRRFVALTDIYRKRGDKQKEIDDVESMIRLLLYSNEIDIEGLIATSSFCYQKGGKETDKKVILDIINAYEKVKPNLDVHAEGYPSADALRKVTPEFGKKLGKGFGHHKYDNVEGVKHIIDVVDKEDDRPVWFGLWGGANTLAQAVWMVQQTRGQEELNRFLSKLRVYGISDQDKGGNWMRHEFGDKLFYIVSPSSGSVLGAAAFQYATWRGISSDAFTKYGVPKGFEGANTAIIDKEWLHANICGDTPYRKLYPLPICAMEGDTPTFLGLIPNGLNDLDHPNYGSWGGRYEFYIPEKAPIFGKKELFPLWTDVKDTVIADGQTTTSSFVTIWRWRKAFQNDFLSRMNWTDTPTFEGGVHPPIVKINVPLDLKAPANKKIMISAKESINPDESNLLFHWFVYKEISTYDVLLENQNSAEVSIVLPAAGNIIHLIAEVTNFGTPAVTRYARIIITTI